MKADDLVSQRFAGLEIKRSGHAAGQDEHIEAVKIQMADGGIRDHSHFVGGDDDRRICDRDLCAGDPGAEQDVRDSERLDRLAAVCEE